MSDDARWSWFVVSRWQAFDGESRANLLRVVAIILFYAAQLFLYFSFADTQAEIRFHYVATTVAVIWICVALVVTVCLQRRFFPSYLPYLSTAADLILLTILATQGSAAHSPLTRIYFLILVLAALRFDVRLIWCATIGSIAAYIFLVGRSDETWFDATHATPVSEQLVMLITLALVGVLLGQIVRRAPTLAEEYARRLSQEGPRP